MNIFRLKPKTRPEYFGFNGDPYAINMMRGRYLQPRIDWVKVIDVVFWAAIVASIAYVCFLAIMHI